MPSWNVTVNLGSNEVGQKRRESYEKAAEKKSWTLSEWVKYSLDAAAGIKFIKDE